MKKKQLIRPLIFWEGFPPCALLIKKVAECYGDDLKLLGTKPAVPFDGLEKLIGHPIDWLHNPNEIWCRRHEFADRNLILHTGWAHSGWLKFDRWIKKCSGAKIIVAVDNRWKGSCRQYAGSIWFRLWLKHHFDATIVPGQSASRLMRFLGMPSNRIFTGYYGATELIYSAGLPLTERRAEFLYVGQLIHRKGVDVLLDAFSRYRASGGTWRLRIIGSGPLEKFCTGNGIIYEGFGQANLVAQRMKESRCLILPSRDDHWGTVVCEAMASGTPVIASRWVGASEDLIRNGINGYTFDSMNSKCLEEYMHRISSWSNSVLENAEKTALGLASGYTSASYFAAFSEIENIFFDLSEDA